MASNLTTQTAFSSSSSSSSTSTPRGINDVFLSFRGEDTRKNFTDHLYAALLQKGIITFRDDEKLGKGKPISPELFKAIRESKFAIIVLSRNYASSTWCLDELAEIVDCMKQTGLIVLPIFYDVVVSDVRKARGAFALVEHEKQFKDRVQRWKAALREVADIAGWDLQHKQESTIIQDIVRKIRGDLSSMFSTVSKDLVGIDSRVDELKNFLCEGSSDVHFVGICGMGGSGKTTLARAVYDKVSHQFDASSFLANVREETTKIGLVNLQKQLLSDILAESNINTRDVDRVSNMIRHRLCHKRVLIVLDDVDQPEQLQALAKKRDWFGGGSRIIVTTRDERLLIENEVAEEEIYKVKELNNDEAVQLFSRNAFKNDRPPKDFVELSKKLLNYSNGLPLALEVLGSFLFRRNVDEWESTLCRLKDSPNKKIQETLQISFDGLEKTEKSIFLDIACFFKGMGKDRVENILKSCGCHPTIGIKELIDKHLITISGGKLMMHDLLEDMGREIVRLESREPGSRSRLWDCEDVLHVLKYNTGTEKVEGIVLNSPPQEVQLNAEVFLKMTKLRFLKIDNVLLPQGLSFISNNLRTLEWHGYPLKSLPMSFQPDKLVELSMCFSHIEQLGKGIMCSDKLTLIDLSDPQNLLKTPDFTGVPNLKRLILQGCTKLDEVHPSIGGLKQLILLNLENCRSLNSLPCNIGLESLKTLILSGCSTLKKFPEIVGDMKNLLQLYLDGTAIKELPLSAKLLRGLTFLNLRDCKNLSSWSVICSLTSLERLILSGCSKLDKMPEELGNLERLVELDVSQTAIRQSSPPKSLLFTCCLSPSANIGLVLPTSFSGLCSLTTLDLSYCNLSDGSIPKDLISLSSLRSLDLSGNNFERIPENISQLSKLRELSLRKCSRLRSLPKLPLRILYVLADYCASLETDFDQIDLRTSDETGVAVISCSRSDEYKDLKLRNISFSRAQTDLMMRKKLEADIFHTNVVCGALPGSGIPKWFNNQNNSSAVTIQLDSDMDDSSKWLGYALYVVVEPHHDYQNLDSTCLNSTIDSKDLDTCVFHFDTDEGPLKQPLVLHIPKKVTFARSIGFWLYVPRLWFAKRLNHLDEGSYIGVSIKSGSPSMEVKMCGARLLYKQNVKEFVETISQFSPGGPDDSHQIYHKFTDTLNLISSIESNPLEQGCPSLDKVSHENEECISKDSCSTSNSLHITADQDQGCKSDSSMCLKTELQPLLLGCYEAKFARNRYKYIFPMVASQLFRNTSAAIEDFGIRNLTGPVEWHLCREFNCLIV